MHFAPFRHGVLEQSSMSIWHTGPVKPEEGTGAAGVRGVACVSLHYEKDAERRWVRVPVGLVPMGRQKKDYSPRRRELGWLGGAQAIRGPRGCLRLCFFPSQVSRRAKTGRERLWTEPSNPRRARGPGPASLKKGREAECLACLQQCAFGEPQNRQSFLWKKRTCVACF